MNIKTRDNSLAGTFTLPAGDIKYILILLHSSDRGERDEDYFKKLADYLKDYGIATYRYDSPGKGKSTGKAFNQSFVDRKNEAIDIYNFFKDKFPDSKIGFSGLSEGAGISLMASKELDDTFIIPVSLELKPYSVERLLKDISDDCDGDEVEIFLCKIWFSLFNLLDLDKNETDLFINKNGEGPWTPVIDFMNRDNSIEELLSFIIKIYNQQKDEYGEYQFMDYFISDVIDQDLTPEEMKLNLNIWREFINFDIREFITEKNVFLVWGGDDPYIDLDENLKECKALFSPGTRFKTYRGYGHGLEKGEEYSIEMFSDIKGWILNKK